MENRENSISAPEENIKTKDVKNERNKQKKGIIIAFALMLSVILVWYAIIPGVNYVLNAVKQSRKNEYTSDYMDHIKSFVFYPADYNEDITEDAEYMQKNRYISYQKGGDTYIITDGDYSGYDSTVEFFARYFDTVKNGNYKEYDSYFTDKYFEEQSNKEIFTPQKLYDIVVKFKGTSSVDGAVSYIYYVDYKIFKNNGTFRNDIESDSSRTLVYELYVYEDGNILINYIGR